MWKIVAAVCLFATSAFAQIDFRPTTPDNFDVTALSCTELLATWDLSTDDEAVRNYVVYQNAPDPHPTFVPHPTSELLLTSAIPSTTYIFEIAASDFENNSSAHSGWVIVTTPACSTVTTTTLGTEDTQAPTVPQNVQAESVACDTVHVTWDESTDDVGVANYTVFQIRDDPIYQDEYEVNVVAHPTTETFFTAIPGETYYYYIGAGDAANNYSPYSNQWPYVTLPHCGPPTTLPGGQQSVIEVHHFYCGDPVDLVNIPPGPDGIKIPITGCELHVKLKQ